LGNLTAFAAAAPAKTAAEPGMDTVEVDLGDRTYPIYIGEGLLDRGELLRRHIPGKTALIVTNETVAPLYLERTLAAVTADGGIKAETVLLPDGEQYKSLDVLQRVWDKALEARLDRNTTFVALGGGVIGDMTGFAAAAYQRGVHFVQIPTTVMAQVDSSVGGKTGVNHPLGKNMIGAFYQPRCVLIDTTSLNTLPDRELASGISEIIKYGLIRDAPLFEWLEVNMERLLDRDQEALKYAINRSCVNKAEVVAADEKEGGVRATLNLGHTFGHAIEAATGYGAWLHGEAVGTGIVMAADMSRRLGWIDEALEKRIRALTERARLPVVPPAGMTVAQFKSFMSVDKKVQDGKLRLILLKGELGSCVITGDFDVAKLEETLEAFCR
jgi:3-dehydroquinate synthase